MMYLLYTNFIVNSKTVFSNYCFALVLSLIFVLLFSIIQTFLSDFSVNKLFPLSAISLGFVCAFVCVSYKLTLNRNIDCKCYRLN